MADYTCHQIALMVRPVGDSITSERATTVRVGDDGVWECKTMVSSDTLFTAVVDGDVSAYRDQCIGALWLTGRQWVDLVLWAPDLASIGRDMTVIRIERNQAEIDALEADLLTFWRRVQSLEAKLRGQTELALAA